MDDSTKTAQDEVRMSLDEFSRDPGRAQRYIYEEHKRVLVMSGDRQVGSVVAYGGDTGRSGSLE